MSEPLYGQDIIDFVDGSFADARKKGPKRGAAEVPPEAIVIGQDPTNQEYLWFDPESLFTHLHVIGASGSGKTNFLKQFARQLVKLKLRRGEGFAIIDPHGDVVEYIRDYIAAKAPQLAEETFYLDFSNTNPVLTLNPLRVYATGQDRKAAVYATASALTEAIMKGAGASSSMDLPLLRRVLNFVYQGLIYTDLPLPAANVFLTRTERNRATLAGLIQKMPDRDVGKITRDFWEEYDEEPRQLAGAKAIGPLNRLDLFTQTVPLRRLVSGLGASVDLKEVMDSGGILLCDLSLARSNATVTVDAQRVFAATLVQQFRQAIANRKPNISRPFTLVMDEIGEYCPPDFREVLTGARKYRVRTVLAHQLMSQLLQADQDRSLIETVLGIPNRVCFSPQFIDEAAVLAKQMFLAELDPDQIKFLPKTLVWDPVQEKVVLRSWAHGGARTETRSEADGSGASTSGGDATVVDPSTGELVRVGASSGHGENLFRSSTLGFAATLNWSEIAAETWVTRYKPRIQEGPPIFRQLDEQVFQFARALTLQPIGQAFVARPGARSRPCKVPFRAPIGYSEAQLKPFLTAMYAKACYVMPEDVDRRLDDGELALLELGAPRIYTAQEEESPPKQATARPLRRTLRKTTAITEATPDTALRAETSGLVMQYESSGLPRVDRIQKDIHQAEKFYANGEWKECILNGRNLLEGVLWDVAAVHAKQAGKPFRSNPGPKAVRDYLRHSGFVGDDVGRMLAQVYSRQSDYVHAIEAPTQENAWLWLRQAKLLSEFVLQKFDSWRRETGHA
jgi:hypothetical protein